MLGWAITWQADDILIEDVECAPPRFYNLAILVLLTEETLIPGICVVHGVLTSGQHRDSISDEKVNASFRWVVMKCRSDH